MLKFIEAISEKTLRTTVALTAARGRGKSAALGLAVAGAVAFGYRFILEFYINGCIGFTRWKRVAHIFFLYSYSNIFVTSPSPDNLHTMFEFIFKGFDAFQYQVGCVEQLLCSICRIHVTMNVMTHRLDL